MYSYLKKAKPILTKMHLFGILLPFYYRLIKTRTACTNHFRKITSKTVPVLLYHRICKISEDPVHLSVTPETFRSHLAFIKQKYSPVSLTELINRVKNHTLEGKEICITFDDGYRDNITNALPILEEFQIPATVFVTTSHLGQVGTFPWDMLYKESDRASFLNEEEIKTLSTHPLIEIGAHTEDHPRLSDLTKKDQEEEIRISKEKLENITNKKIRHFAYPFGGKRDFSQTTIDITKRLGFESAYENTDFLGTEKSNVFSFPRINIRECGITNLKKKIYAK